MKANHDGLAEQIWKWLDENTTENRRKLWSELTTGTEQEQFEEEIYAFFSELAQSARNKQKLAEERQILLNKWMKEKEDAEKSLQAAQERLEDKENTIRDFDQRIKGYEQQLVSLEKTFKEERQNEKLAEIKAELNAVSVDRDNAWAQFTDREQQLDRIRQELGEVRADRDNAWAQFTDREQQLDRIRQELDNAQKTITELERKAAEAEEKAERLRTELLNAKQYGTDMAMKVAEMDKLLPVRLYRKLHKSER